MITINVLMAIFTLLLLGIGTFLITHQKRSFLIFHPGNNQLLSAVIKNFGIAYLITGVISLVALLVQNTIFICGALVIGCACVLTFQICLSKFMPKK